MGALTTTSLAASALASAAIVLSEGLWVEETNDKETLRTRTRGRTKLSPSEKNIKFRARVNLHLTPAWLHVHVRAWRVGVL